MKKVEYFKYQNNTAIGDCCPECKASWDGGDIYEHFLEAKFNPNHEQHSFYKDKTLYEIKKSAGNYGWTDKTPVRFGKVIGIDCSMDLNATGDDQYDGVSYWKCPECEIAWHRFKGFRTDKFVKNIKESDITKEIKKKLAKLKGVKDLANWKPEEDRIIIYNAIQTPDGTIISSDHRHDFVTHTDKNGKTYGVDGGTEYLRRIGDVGDCIDLSMYFEPITDEFHEKARKVVKRGGRGKKGDQPITYTPICEMNDKWVLATIDYNTERGMKDNWFTKLLHYEMHYRNANFITIKEDEDAK